MPRKRISITLSREPIPNPIAACWPRHFRRQHSLRRRAQEDDHDGSNCLQLRIDQDDRSIGLVNMRTGDKRNTPRCVRVLPPTQYRASAGKHHGKHCNRHNPLDVFRAALDFSHRCLPEVRIQAQASAMRTAMRWMSPEDMNGLQCRSDEHQTLALGYRAPKAMDPHLRCSAEKTVLGIFTALRP
jgi:hypothetical protein